jgi:hypothetical protein
VTSISSLSGGNPVFAGSTQVISSSELRVDDPDDAADALVYDVTAAPVSGRLELAGSPGVAIGSFTQADLDAGRVVYVRVAALASSDAFGFQVLDGAGSGTSGTFALDLANIAAAPLPPELSPVEKATSSEPEEEPEPETETETQEDTADEEAEEATSEDPVEEVVEDVVEVGEAAPERVGGLPVSGIIPNATPGGAPIRGASGSATVNEHSVSILGRANMEAPGNWSERAPHQELTVQEYTVRPSVWQFGTLEDALDVFRREIAQEDGRRQGVEELTVQTIEGTALAISTSVLASLLRSSSLWAAAASAMPLWRRMDPLVVLSVSNEEREKMLTDLRSADSDEKRPGRVLDGSSDSEA